LPAGNYPRPLFSNKEIPKKNRPGSGCAGYYAFEATTIRSAKAITNSQEPAILRQIRKVIGAQCPNQRPNIVLLQQFIADRDEAAFAALVNRHGSMVLAVCRSVLHDQHDAEDAFQAVFLLLARSGFANRRRWAAGFTGSLFGCH
jgi:Sigma-70 region 2